MLTTGQRIKSLRKNKGLTQEKLAELIGVDFKTIQRWEADKRFPYADNLVKLSAVLGVSAEHILNGKGEDHEP